MIWLLIILIVAALAAYVYLSMKVAVRLLERIVNLENQVSELYDNDEWCEHSINSISLSNESFADDLEREFHSRMSDIAKVWKKMGELNNEINRTKMRVGKIEQGDTSKIEPAEFGDGARIEEE